MARLLGRVPMWWLLAWLPHVLPNLALLWLLLWLLPWLLPWLLAWLLPIRLPSWHMTQLLFSLTLWCLLPHALPKLACVCLLPCILP